MRSQPFRPAATSSVLISVIPSRTARKITIFGKRVGVSFTVFFFIFVHTVRFGRRGKEERKSNPSLSAQRLIFLPRHFDGNWRSARGKIGKGLQSDRLRSPVLLLHHRHTPAPHQQAILSRIVSLVVRGGTYYSIKNRDQSVIFPPSRLENHARKGQTRTLFG